MASNNPGNFANRPKEEVREIAAKGGHASHGGDSGGQSESASSDNGRRLDGTFLPGHNATNTSHDSGNSGGGNDEEVGHTGRRADGTFVPGSQAAHDAGVKGGHNSHIGDTK